MTARSRLRRSMVRNTRSSGTSSARSAIAASSAASRSRSGPSLRRFSRSCRPTLAPRTSRRICAPHCRNVVERSVDRAESPLGHRRGARRRPVRPLDAGVAVPFRIGRDHRAALVGAPLARAAGRVRRRSASSRRLGSSASSRRSSRAASTISSTLFRGGASARRNPTAPGRRRDRPARPHRYGR